MDRRQFLIAAGASGAAGVAASQTGLASSAASSLIDTNSSWAEVKAQFDMAPDIVQMSAFYLASHPKIVRDAIELHRRGLDREAHGYIGANLKRLENGVRAEASKYMNVKPDELAFVDSTTMGLGIVYSGLALTPEQEILSDTRDHIVTNNSCRFCSQRNGANYRQTALYADPAKVTVDEVVRNVRDNLKDNTRLFAMTWVHSGTGVKMPVQAIAEVVDAHNRGKSDEARTLFALDGVHGFGNQDVDIPDLGVDYFIAGTHKWLTGPRGTGLIWSKPSAWQFARPSISTFDPMWRDGPPQNMPMAAWMTPGGFHSFEHRWALEQAFQFHSGIGRKRVADRTTELNTMAKERMATMPKVKLHTPMSPELSAGIITFEVEGYTPKQAVAKLHDDNIIASVVPSFYRPLLPRIAPSIVTVEEDVERTLAAIARL